jgi:hypothetical protein
VSAAQRSLGRMHHTTAWAARELGRERLRDAGAAWLARVPWRVGASLTFATLPTEGAALVFLRKWVCAIATAMKAHVTYAYGAALDGSAGSHFHVLLACDRQPTVAERRVMGSVWHARHGFARIRRYAPGRGAESYLLRHPSWDRGAVCPEPRASSCRRGRQCPEARRYA